MEMQGNQSASNSQPLTTFVQVDTATFKQVVQQLTGSSNSKALPEAMHEAESPSNFKPGTVALQQVFLEHQQLRSPGQGFSPSRPEYGVIRSSPLSTPTNCFSSLSLGESDSGEESLCQDLNAEEEEKAIRERRFYLHPSPRLRPQFSQPELLSLFPLTSPKYVEHQG